MQPGNYHRQRSRTEQAKFERKLIGTVIAIIVFMSIIGLITNPHKSVPAESAPPAHESLLFNLINQHIPLHMGESVPFTATGTMRIVYVCARHSVDVQFYLLRLTQSGNNYTMDKGWSLSCPGSGMDEIEASGMYTLTVSVGGSGDAGWGITIMQE